MADFSLGYLFEVFLLNEDGKEEEIFEFKGAVSGIKFNNKNNVERFHIISNGKCMNSTVDVIASTRKEQKDLESKYVVFPKALEYGLEVNDNKVNVSDMLVKISNRLGGYKYFERENPYTSNLDACKNQSKYEKLLAKKEEKAELENIRTSDIYEMYEKIRKTIVSQDEAIMKILTTLFKNQMIVDTGFSDDLISNYKENLLVCGFTGTGKTEIIKRIARIFDIPIVIEDITTISEVGYHGRDVVSMLEDLWNAANKDIERAERGILVIDEIDKIAEKDGNNSHVSRGGVQRSLLKLLDGTTFYFNNVKFDTSKLTVISLGAFIGISEDYINVTEEDFHKYGMMKELIGRFSKTVIMNKLDEDDLKQIVINSDFSPLNTYAKFFETMKISYSYTDEFVEWFVKKVATKNEGARSIKKTFEECISDALFNIFSGKYNTITLVKPETESSPAYILTKNESTLEDGKKSVLNFFRKKE